MNQITLALHPTMYKMYWEPQNKSLEHFMYKVT